MDRNVEMFMTIEKSLVQVGLSLVQMLFANVLISRYFPSYIIMDALSEIILQLSQMVCFFNWVLRGWVLNKAI